MDTPLRLRYARLYLLSIGLVSLFILFLSILSMVRQFQTHVSQSLDKKQLVAERLAVALERQVWQEVESCLRDPELRNIILDVIDSSKSGQNGRVQAQLAKVTAKHPIAEHLFFLQDGRIRFHHQNFPQYPLPDDNLGDKQVYAGRAGAGRDLKVRSDITPEPYENLAREVEAALLKANPDKPEKLQPLSVTSQTSGVQLFSVLFSGSDRQARLLAISLNQAWVAGPLLTQCKALIHTDANPVLAFDAAQATASESSVPLQTVFPFLTLRFPQNEAANAGLEVVLTAGTAVMLLCLLGLIFLLLSRISRELTVLQMRSDFMRVTSHELKTPLTLISIFSENLITHPDLSGEERLNCYQVIHRESCRLSNLARNLLHVPPIAAEKQEFILSEGNLADVVDKTAKVCSLWLGRQGFTLRSEIASALPPVRFDQEKVAQALMIVFDNARKYSGSSRTIDVRLRAQGSSVIVEVQDYGIGIPEKEKDKIFDEHYRASNVREQLGFGLGLFVAKEIMRAHHGTIEVHSEAGRGSRFQMVFPAGGKILADEPNFAVSPDRP